jgi:hypothetical protein
MSVKVFIDESGSTGDDVFQEDQPYYTSAGVWLEERNTSDLQNILDDIREEPGVQMPVFKGKDLMGTGSGVQAMIALLKEIGNRGFQTTLVTVHKQFMSASVIVEEYTDRYLNPMFPSDWSQDALNKERLAQAFFSRLPDSTLQEWWEARRGTQKDRFISAHSELLDSIRDVPSLEGIDEIFSHFDPASYWDVLHPSDGPSPYDFSPNGIVFPRLLQMIHGQGRSLDHSDVKIIHDDQDEYQDEYEFYTSALTSASEGEVYFTNGNSYTLPTDVVSSLEFESDEDSPGLQVADCLATAARVLAHEERPYNQLERLREPIRTLYEANRVKEESRFVVGPLNWQGPTLLKLMGKDPDMAA